jgi:HlyD family secretion protein
MKSSSRSRRAFLSVAALALLGACQRQAPAGWQGYLEGEFVHVASPLGGRLDKLAVRKGARVEAGATLFTLEHAGELATQQEATNRLQSSRARLADLKKGLRPSELTALEARIEQARAAADLSKRELDRMSDLFKTGATAASDFDRARLTHDRNMRAVEQFNAELATAQLGGRSDAVAAAEAEVAAALAARDRAEWAVAQKTQSAPKSAFVYDTLYWEGEFVGAGTPIVTLLPPENLKVRFFVPEAEFANLNAGERLRVLISGRSQPIDAQINYLSPRPEFTPPILYNRDNRAKLVFLVEAVIDADAARELHPGQPVDVIRAP